PGARDGAYRGAVRGRLAPPREPPEARRPAGKMGKPGEAAADADLTRPNRDYLGPTARTFVPPFGFFLRTPQYSDDFRRVPCPGDERPGVMCATHRRRFSRWLPADRRSLKYPFQKGFRIMIWETPKFAELKM